MYDTVEESCEASIMEAAERISSLHQSDNLENDVNIEEIVQQLGGTVRRHTERYSAPLLDIAAPGDFTIWLPSGENLLQDRLLLARGIGYYILQYKGAGRDTSHQVELPERVEFMEDMDYYDVLEFMDAEDLFALHLLAPRQQFLALYEKYDSSVVEIADILQIPVSVAEYLEQAFERV